MGCGLFFFFVPTAFCLFLLNKREKVRIVGNYFPHLGEMKLKKAELLHSVLVRANFQERTGVSLKFS